MDVRGWPASLIVSLAKSTSSTCTDDLYKGGLNVILPSTVFESSYGEFLLFPFEKVYRYDDEAAFPFRETVKNHSSFQLSIKRATDRGTLCRRNGYQACGIRCNVKYFKNK